MKQYNYLWGDDGAESIEDMQDERWEGFGDGEI